jgi:serine phosphatase RsbU (regulator of sigma subunit)
MPILVGIQSSVIYIWNEDQGTFKAAHAVTKGKTDLGDLLETAYKPADFPMLEAVFRNNHPIVYPFTEVVLPPDDWDLVLPDEGQIDTMSVVKSRYPLLMGFPLSMQDDVFGVLLASDINFSTNRERRFELIWGMAQQASLAIQNDIINKEMFERQRLEREFQLAREIQQTFLPDHVPEIPGWQIDVRWETARLVGGDFYDYFLLPDGRLGFVIADVSDKGLAASLYMSVTRTLIRAAAPENKSPARTLERVNDLLLVNSQDGLFVTVFYGILSLSDGTLTYTIAGHNPPMISRYQSQEIEILGKGGIALGALPDIHLDEEITTLHAGDCLVLYTDGVTETFNANEDMYGETRLKNTLSKTIGKGASVLIEALEADLNHFRGNIPLSDDTTILAICKQLLLANDNRNPGSSQDAINSAAE